MSDLVHQLRDSLKSPIYIFDNLISFDEIEKLYRSLLLAKYVSYQVKDGEDGLNVFYNLFQARLHTEDFTRTPLFKSFSRCLKLVSKESDLKFTQVFCNAFRFGETVFPHEDEPLSGKSLISVLYCVNDVWEPDWEGETYFFDDKYDAQELVSFRPGRIIVFDGSISHRPGMPSRICPKYRLALNARFEF